MVTTEVQYRESATKSCPQNSTKEDLTEVAEQRITASPPLRLSLIGAEGNEQYHIPGGLAVITDFVMCVVF